MAWNPDSFLLYVMQRADNGTTLRQLSLLDRSVSDLARLSGYTSGVKLSPDGRYLLYMIQGSDASLRAYDLTTGSEVILDSGSVLPPAISNDWGLYYGTYQSEGGPKVPLGIHHRDIQTGQDTVVIPNASIQAVDVAHTGTVKTAVVLPLARPLSLLACVDPEKRSSRIMALLPPWMQCAKGVQSQVAGVGVQAIDYPAVAIPNTLDKDYLNKYAASVSSGNNKLAAYLVQFLARCSTTYVDLTGFSQGAQVAKTTMEKLSIDQRHHIAGLALIGEPTFNPLNKAMDRGDYDPY